MDSEVSNSMEESRPTKDQRSLKRYILHLTPFLLLLVAIFLAQYGYQDPLFQRSLELIKQYQTNQSQSTTNFFEFITFFGYGIIQVSIISLYFSFGNRHDTFYLIIVFSIISFINFELKTAYHNPRPFYVDEELDCYGSPLTYGNPSGHASETTCFFISLYLVMFGQFPKIQFVSKKNFRSTSVVDNYDVQARGLSGQLEKHKSQQLTYQAWWGGYIRHKTSVQAVSAVILASLLALIGISRVILGDHSIDQVLFGWCIGTWTSFFLYYFFYVPITQHIRKTLEAELEFGIGQFSSYQRGEAIANTAKVISVWLILIVLAMINYYFVNKNFWPPDQWIFNMIKCNDNSQFKRFQILHHSAFIKSGMISSVFGAYIGIVLDALYFGGTKPIINHTSVRKGIGRLLMLGIVGGIILLPYFLVDFSENIFVLYMFKTTIPFFILSLVMFSLFKLMLGKMKLVNIRER